MQRPPPAHPRPSRLKSLPLPCSSTTRSRPPSPPGTPTLPRHAKEAADAAAAAAAAAKSRPSSAFYPSSTTPPPPPGVVANVAATASSLPSFLPSSSSSSSSAGSANAAASPPFHGASQKPPPQAGGIFLPLAAEDDPPEELIPCENFALVCKGVYRSAFPKKKNFPFLKRLRLKSVLTLILEEYPEQNQRFLEENDISFFQFGVAGNKEPFVDIPEETICAALTVIMDRRNHPLLIHCNKGKHRTGCLVGCLRKLQTWSYTSIFDEYRRFSHPKSRVMDQQFIELFDERAVVADPRWLPAWPEIADSPCRATLRVLPDPGEEEPGRRDEVRGSRVVVVVGLQ
ncbi:tyrosine phosphatase family-domain-containing protein [Zopfochytrium polystomum]|nr:tyrosine phosphatase family-domain-containing protein [Zopfochytrium polystomum]